MNNIISAFFHNSIVFHFTWLYYLIVSWRIIAIKNNSHTRFIRDTCTMPRKNALLSVTNIVNIIIIHTTFLMYTIHYLYEYVLTIFQMKQNYWTFIQYLRAYFLAYFIFLKLCVRKKMINFVATSRLHEIYWIATPIKNAR